MRQYKSKNSVILIAIISFFLFFYIGRAAAEVVSIKGVTKIHRNGSYIILINYETREKITGNIFFKVYCKFDKEDFIYTSNSLNNIKRGMHKVKLPISYATKNKSGSLREYTIDLYRNGTLMSTKRSY